MTERDEEGRPIATKNAGAFLGPFSGVVPVPSDAADDAAAPEAMTPRARRLLADGTAIAIWTLCFSVLQIVLSGTQEWAGGGHTAGQNLLAILHTPVFLVAAHLVFLALAVRVGSRIAGAQETGERRVLAVVTFGGALLVAAVVLAVGDLAAAIGGIFALMWLGAVIRVLQP